MISSVTVRNFTKFASGVGRGVLILLLIVSAGCETSPPVQEMSDARMAIAVARKAGAAVLAAEDLRAAESFLNSARLNLSKQAYAEARTDAVEAKNRALDALENSENSDEPQSPR